MIFPMGIWVYHDLKPLALEAEKLFRALGFPDPDKLDFRPGSYDSHHENYDGDEQSVYYYQAVLDAHRSGHKVHIDVISQGEIKRREDAAFLKDNPNYEAERDAYLKASHEKYLARKKEEKSKRKAAAKLKT